jgi:hypothetical protein
MIGRHTLCGGPKSDNPRFGTACPDKTSDATKLVVNLIQTFQGMSLSLIALGAPRPHERPV